MDETGGFRQVLKRMDVDVDKLPEEVEITGSIRWVSPALGLAFLGFAGGLYYSQTQKPSRPYGAVSVQTAYSSIMANGGTTTDMNILSESLTKARAVFGQSPKGLDFLLQRDDIVTPIERQFLAAQTVQELESFYWNDNGKGDSLPIIFGLIGISCLVAGAVSHYQYRRDNAYLTILEREKTESGNEFH
ncbi:hypothetical protein HYV86_06320 [Candidatus Woesearchaeota archaeon]|nr:hypothetical protein [Candidatus Woesearchaeota archaeon]